MTMPAQAKPFGERLPSAKEKAAANQLRQILAQQSGEAKLRVLGDGKQGTAEIVLGPDLSNLLMEMLRYIGSGDAVTLVPISRMLTTQQAADILNVSRPYLISLLDKQELPHSMVGRHRRIKAQNLFAYKQKRDTDREAALSELAALDSELI